MKYGAALKYLQLFGTFSAATALLTPAWPAALQPSHTDIRAISKRARKCSGCIYGSTEHQVPKENHTGCAKQASKQRQQHCTQNRGLFLWTVPVHLEVLFPSQQCGQKRPLVSLGPREDFLRVAPSSIGLPG